VVVLKPALSYPFFGAVKSHFHKTKKQLPLKETASIIFGSFIV